MLKNNILSFTKNHQKHVVEKEDNIFLRLLGALFLVSATIAGAHAAPPSPPPLIDTINGEQPIRLKSLSISGEISGSLAETTVRMVFFNPNARPLEGRVQFPLLPGQQIIAFALDIDGSMRPAVPVEKAKGRQVFEAVERRQADPALLEDTLGNNFSLKVYPIASLGTRTVEFKYSEALVRDGANWVYRLPLAFGEQPLDFDLTLEVNGTGVQPEAKSALGRVVFEKTDGKFLAHIAKAQFLPVGRLDVLLPATMQPKTFVQERDGDTYFVTEIPVTGQPSLRPQPPLKIIGLLWDSSGSGANRSHEAEFEELDRYFHALGRAEVKLTRLRDRPEATEEYKVVNGDWSALRRALEGTVYDGASALADWQPQKDVNEYLLVSDGLLNYGPTKFPTLARDTRLYALNSALSADTNRLSALAESTGGKLIQIDPGAPGSTVEALLHDGPHLQDLRADGATAVLVDSANPQQGVVRVAGKLLTRTATLHFTLVQGGESHEMAVLIEASAPVHPLAAHLWATYKLHSLEADYEIHRGEIRRLGEQFGMPTRETSLIVLDHLEDYVRYDVAPPPALRDAFEKLKAENGRLLSEKRNKQLASIVHQFEEKTAWWEKEYDKSDPDKNALGSGRTGDIWPPGRGDILARDGSSPMAMAPPRLAMEHSRSAPLPSATPAPAMPAPAAAKRADAPAEPAPEIGIALKKWQSDAPYISRMKSASEETIYAVYLDEKPSYANSTAFFLDAADMLLEKGKRDLALRVLSNLAEMDLENRHVLRVLGYRLMQAGAPDLAISVFEKVRWLAEDEPQSFRDLGLAYWEAKRYQQAIDQLNEVVVRPWDGRFAEIELIALAEMNAIIATAPTKLNTDAVDPRLLRNLPLDIRVVLTWDSNDSDMDLWVTDPNGEKCFYGHRFTRQGGRLSLDYTNGYGPEEFSLRKAKPGKYKIEANFFGSRQQLVAGPTTLQIKLTTGFGTPEAKDVSTNMRLKARGDTVFVGEFEVKQK
jgi:tetratricopeptide (TPR) repeat protein